MTKIFKGLLIGGSVVVGVGTGATVGVITNNIPIENSSSITIPGDDSNGNIDNNNPGNNDGNAGGSNGGNTGGNTGGSNSGNTGSDGNNGTTTPEIKNNAFAPTEFNYASMVYLDEGLEVGRSYLESKLSNDSRQIIQAISSSSTAKNINLTYINGSANFNSSRNVWEALFEARPINGHYWFGTQGNNEAKQIKVYLNNVIAAKKIKQLPSANIEYYNLFVIGSWDKNSLLTTLKNNNSQRLYTSFTYAFNVHNGGSSLFSSVDSLKKIISLNINDNSVSYDNGNWNLSVTLKPINGYKWSDNSISEYNVKLIFKNVYTSHPSQFYVGTREMSGFKYI